MPVFRFNGVPFQLVGVPGGEVEDSLACVAEWHLSARRYLRPWFNHGSDLPADHPDGISFPEKAFQKGRRLSSDAQE